VEQAQRAAGSGLAGSMELGRGEIAGFKTLAKGLALGFGSCKIGSGANALERIGNLGLSGLPR